MDMHGKQTLMEHLNYVHCVLQELENIGIELPMGDYGVVYRMVEEARDYFGEG